MKNKWERAKDIVVDPTNLKSQPTKPRRLKLKEDRSLDLVTDEEFPGFLYVQAYLYAMQPPPRKALDKSQVKYEEYNHERI